MRNNVKLVHLGRVAGLPEMVSDSLRETMELTKNNTGMALALALNYSGRAEIVDAARAIAQACKDGRLAPEDIDERCISEHLYTAKLNDPDLLIRTASELRVSNFLLWQISYSEFYVTDTLWPEFDEGSLDKAFLAYARRDRRFGAIDTGALASSRPARVAKS
jgi:undecaprenyl diphosphate synthase